MSIYEILSLCLCSFACAPRSLCIQYLYIRFSCFYNPLNRPYDFQKAACCTDESIHFAHAQRRQAYRPCVSLPVTHHMTQSIYRWSVILTMGTELIIMFMKAVQVQLFLDALSFWRKPLEEIVAIKGCMWSSTMAMALKS